MIDEIRKILRKFGEAMGEKGFTYKNGAGTITPPTGMVFTNIDVVADGSNILAYTLDTGCTINGDTILGETLYQGDKIWARFKSITFAGTGKIRAYIGQ